MRRPGLSAPPPLRRVDWREVLAALWLVGVALAFLHQVLAPLGG